MSYIITDEQCDLILRRFEIAPKDFRKMVDTRLDDELFNEILVLSTEGAASNESGWTEDGKIAESLLDTIVAIEYNQAREFSRINRKALAKDDVCGCFYCMSIFSPKEIEEWVPERWGSKKEVTALCPHCGIDSVIGASSGYPITVDFLRGMNKISF